MNKKSQNTIPQEEIIIIKQIDLLAYLLQFEPNSIIKNGNHYESIIHEGLCIYSKKWNWKRKGQNGKSALEYLVFVERMGFLDAAYLLKNCMIASDGHLYG